jgi:hypothetical protein
VLSQAGADSHLSVRLAPAFLLPLERWVGDALAQENPPPRAEVSRCLAEPLLAQIEIDAGPTVAKLADGRLGIHGELQSVRQQARKLGVTRARVYQLLDDCAQVMAVRWPEGAGAVNGLVEKLARGTEVDDSLELLRSTSELFFYGVARLDGEVADNADRSEPREAALENASSE